VIDIALSLFCSLGSTVFACQFSQSIERARWSFMWRKTKRLSYV